MASITIRNLDDEVKTDLRIHATEHQRSMEEETHGSWLNRVESFFGKMARTLLRGIRVHSREELKQRIQRYTTGSMPTR